MKTRNGFVSNSSSSSFVIAADKEIKTVFDLAIKMIPTREWGDDDKLIRKIKSSKVNPDNPIMFRSCNYDTYIIKEGKYFVVETCNNHDWYELDLDFVNNIPKEIQKGYCRGGYYDYDYGFDVEGIEFYVPELNIIGTEVPYNSKMDECWCKKCYHNYFIAQDGERVCACNKPRKLEV